MLVAPLLFLASCGGSGDIVGKWKFSDVTFPNGKPAEVTDEQIGEMKEMFKTMTYTFTKDSKFEFQTTFFGKTEKQSGTYKVAGEDLTLKFDKKEEKMKIKEASSDKLVLEPVMEGESMKGKTFQLVFTK